MLVRCLDVMVMSSARYTCRLDERGNTLINHTVAADSCRSAHTTREEAGLGANGSHISQPPQAVAAPSTLTSHRLMQMFRGSRVMASGLTK